MPQNREEWIAETLVELADTLVPALDPASFWPVVADRYTRLVASASVRLAVAGENPGGQMVVHTDERLGEPPLDGLFAREGPGFDCHSTGVPVVNARLEEATARWPRLAPAALSLGYRSVHAFPFNRREDILGSVTILTTGMAPLPSADIRIASALADVATIGMLNHRAIAKLTETSSQLQGALTSRVPIEQAKGLVSARLEVSPSEAFLLMRRYARSHNQRISEVSEKLVARRLTASGLLEERAKASRRS
ncbi:ANTAR domain-containing protein [Amycolatopsis azurea]|uniref:ANTAR domain-containing protein n=1 Tax=Amycolatopsis azurea DSM 43854 TaxID=1238180 RepID=M2PTM7_9PSEU|nr:ANTAR domain-containing protein [Amycolatopsis azurea]EMD22875.1 hypothetical protein C791_7875 [Amycolatopsis azurea DSM 43854]OOC04245.1 ANTAR domain-containing protein [Amycolatopsis azurea DSM 43854]